MYLDQWRTSVRNKLHEKDLDFLNILICSEDGQVFFSQTGDDSLDTSSIGALINNGWRAVELLKELSFEGYKKENFKLSFSNSDSGILILPVTLANKECLLGAIYKNVINPAVLKNKVKVLVNYIEKLDFVEQFETDNKTKLLFSDLTQEEIDVAFSNIMGM